MWLPAPIQAYFDAEKEFSSAGPIHAFAPDAVVKDEGHAYVGRDAIEAWWRAAKARYHHTAEPRETFEDRGLIKVRAEVSGRFPGSPAVLCFAFQLKDAQIVALDIGA